MGARNDGGAYEREEASKRAAARLLTKLGTRVEQLDRWIQEVPDDYHHIIQVRFAIRYSTVGDVLAMVKATTDDGKEIAFHSDDTVSEAMTGLVNRLNNGTLKWREDTPYDQKGN